MQDIAKLGPLGPTDSYAYTNGTIVTYGEGMMRFYASGSEHGPVIVPKQLWPVIVAVAEAFGLSNEQGNQLAEAAETYA